MASTQSMMPSFTQRSFMPDLFSPPDIQRRDANKFYWKSRPPKRVPISNFVYEYEQWRHGGEPASFWGYIHFDPDEDEILGTLECEIEAENLTTVAKLLVPARLKLKKRSVLKLAENKVDHLALGWARRPS